jgi:hypothetical protein
LGFRVVASSKCRFFQKIFLILYFFLKYVHTMTMHITLWQLHCNV